MIISSISCARDRSNLTLLTTFVPIKLSSYIWSLEKNKYSILSIYLYILNDLDSNNEV